MFRSKRLYKTIYIYSFAEMIGSYEVPTVESCSNFFADGQPAIYQGLTSWAQKINEDETKAGNVNQLLSMIAGRNPDVAKGTEEYPTDGDKLIFLSRFWSWVRESEPEMSMRLDLLNKTASELLADVVSTTSSERKADSDRGKDTTASSDMPITATFAATLPNADNLEDKMSMLNIAKRDYSHLWKDVVTSNDPRGTLPQRIDEALSVYRSIFREWTEEFMDRFALIGEEQDEIFE